MKSRQRPAVVALMVVAIAAIFVTVMSDAPSAQRIASEFGAAGAPYADPAYCDALPKLLTNFEGTVLPEQARMLARQETRLQEAEAGRSEAEADFNSALRDGIIKLGTDQIATAKVMAERVRNLKKSGLTDVARREWLTKIKNIEDTGNLLKVGVARADYAELVKQNQDNLVSFMKFVEESGAADILVKGLVDLVAPGVGSVIVGGIKVGLDVAYAGLRGRFTAQEAAQWRENVDRLKGAHQDLKSRVDGYRDDLTSGLCGPKVAQQVQNSPRPIVPEGAAPPPSSATPPPPPRSGGGMGKVIGWSAIIGGGIVGGMVLAQTELDDLSYLDPPTTTTTTTTNSTPTGNTNSAGTMTYLGGTFTCTFNQGGILNLCNNSNIRVNITTRMAVGTTLRLTASGMVSSSLPQTRTDPPGEVIFQNFNGPGNFDTCPAPIRQLLLFNTSRPNEPVAVAAVSIPVSCR